MHIQLFNEGEREEKLGVLLGFIEANRWQK